MAKVESRTRTHHKSKKMFKYTCHQYIYVRNVNKRISSLYPSHNIFSHPFPSFSIFVLIPELSSDLSWLPSLLYLASSVHICTTSDFVLKLSELYTAHKVS